MTRHVADAAGAEQTLHRIRELGLVTVIRGQSPEAAVEVSRTLIQAGVKGIEVTFTTPEADRVLRDLSSEYGDKIVLGAGTLTSPREAATAAEAGATFLVSPGCDDELLPEMRRTGLLSMPGVLTPTEVMVARRLGAGPLKLFPGSSGGPALLRALRGPFPEAPFMPTGGVSADNIPEWFAAGAFAVGVGGALAPPALRSSEDRERLSEKAAEFLRSVRNAAGEPHRTRR